MQRALVSICGLAIATSLGAPVAAQSVPAESIPRSPSVQNVDPALLQELQVVRSSATDDFIRRTGVDVEARLCAENQCSAGPELNRVQPAEAEKAENARQAPADKTSRRAFRRRRKTASVPVVGPETEVIRPEPVRASVTGPGAHIVPGVPVRPARKQDSYTDVAAIGLNGRWRCTGVLVAPDVVLTAAHCLPATAVAFGYDLSKQREEYQVTASERAPGGLDVALLRLERATSRKPRPWRLTGDVLPPSGALTIVGFGSNSTSGEGGYGVLRKNSVDTHGWGCDSWRASVFGCSIASEMVLRSAVGNDTCRGDSGGPVFESVAGETRLVAITSRPIPTAEQPCGSGGIYVRMDAVSEWVLSQVAKPRKTGSAKQ